MSICLWGVCIVLLLLCYYYISLNLESNFFQKDEWKVTLGTFVWKLTVLLFSICHYDFDPLHLSFLAKNWTLKISQRSLVLTFNKALASVSVPYSQQWLLPFNEKVKPGIVSRALRTFSIEMQTLPWRLWKFWEIVGFWRCFQKNWHPFPVHGWFKLFCFQVYSSKVSSWLSLAGQTPNLNAEQKSNFFIPNLGLWPINLITSPLQMQFSFLTYTLLNSVHQLPQPSRQLWQWLGIYPNKDHLYVVKMMTGIVLNSLLQPS